MSQDTLLAIAILKAMNGNGNVSCDLMVKDS